MSSIVNIRRSSKKAETFNKRTTSKEKNFKEVVYTRVGKVKSPTKTFHQRLSYDFLQYIRIVFKWACDNYNITRPHLELMLCIYPVGIFRVSDFNLYARTIDMKPSRLFDTFMENGWIKLWRPHKGKQAALYCLTTRGKIMCGKVHKICVGESKIPENSRTNVLVNSDKSIDKYYMNIIKKMNQRDLSKASEVEDDVE